MEEVSFTTYHVLNIKEGVDKHPFSDSCIFVRVFTVTPQKDGSSNPPQSSTGGTIETP